MSILVTGASGGVGIEVVKNLIASGVHLTQRVIAAVGPTTQTDGLFPDEVACVNLDFRRRETFASVLQDVTSLFLVRPPPVSNVKRDIVPFIDASRDAGVRHVAFLSVVGADDHPWTPHHQIEQYLKKSPVSWTLLRASYFMQNLTGIHRPDIQYHDCIYLPVGRGRSSLVDVRDIGAVAATVLATGGYLHKALDLTGPAALNFYEVASVLSRALDREILYTDPSALAFVASHVWNGTPVVHTLVMAYIYHLTKQGMSAFVTRDVEEVLGRPATTFEQFAEDFKSAWT